MDSTEELLELISVYPSQDEADRLGSRVEDLYTPLFYATRLLQVLRQERDSYRVATRHRPGRRWLEGPIERARGPVAEVFGRGPRIAGDHRERIGVLRDWLEQVAGDTHPPIVLARVLAKSIETASAATFWEQLQLYYGVRASDQDSSTRPLRSGDPVPVCNKVFAANAFVDRSSDRRTVPSTNPRNLPRWREPDRLARVLLAPPGVEQFQVRLDFRFDTDLELLLEGDRIATVHPTSSLEEYAWRDDGHRFWDVHPRVAPHDDDAHLDEDAYIERLKSSIDAAVDAGAGLIVLPELSVTQPQLQHVMTHWRRRRSELAEAGAGTDQALPALLVAGSYHAEIDDDWRNVSTVAAQRWDATIDKLVPYAHRMPESPDGDLVENIPQRRRPPITIYCCEQMTMVIYVCVDFLLDGLRDLVRDLDVTLIVLPSMSAKSRVFEGLVAGQVAGSQSVVVLANALSSADGGSRGLIGHPNFDRQTLDLNDAWKQGASDGPGVAVVDTGDDSACCWIPIP